MFPVGTYKEETQNSAHLMEQVLQYQVDSKRLTKYLFNFFNDGELYGLGILIAPWKKETAKRTVWREEDKSMFGISLGKGSGPGQGGSGGLWRGTSFTPSTPLCSS